MRKLLSRIVFRILALNVLLLFLPLAGLLYIDVYEENLVLAQRQTMTELASAVASIVSTLEPAAASAAVDSLPVGTDARIRLVDESGRILADTAGPNASTVPYHADDPRDRFLYRLGTAVLKKPVQWLRGRENVPATGEAYESAQMLGGTEIIAALRGEPSSSKRIVPGSPPTVILYETAPTSIGGEPGAILVSQTTHRVLHGLYDIRLRTFRIFVIALVVAIALSLWISATIVRPIRALRRQAGGILDRRGRLRSGFTGTDKEDEIGELSRALERLTARLESFQEFNESFAADISHEFKNPLASIRTATELLDQAEDEQEKSRFIRVIEREVVRMERLLESLHEVSTIDARLETEEVQPVDLRDLLEKLTDGYRQRERGRIEIALHSEVPEALVRASEDRLYQVFSNLLDNAVSFSPDGESVEISLARGPDEWKVSICDRGPGIPDAHHQKVFDRFFTWREERNGLFHAGLGLAIVRAVVEGYGGEVAIRNRKGGGTCVIVSLS